MYTYHIIIKSPHAPNLHVVFLCDPIRSSPQLPRSLSSSYHVVMCTGPSSCSKITSAVKPTGYQTVQDKRVYINKVEFGKNCKCLLVLFLSVYDKLYRHIVLHHIILVKSSHVSSPCNHPKKQEKTIALGTILTRNMIYNINQSIKIWGMLYDSAWL